jgi:uncharacterized protein YjdB
MLFVRKTRAGAFVAVLCVAAAAFSACSKDAVGPAVSSVGSVVVEPPSATVAVNSSLTLNAEVLGPDGGVLSDARISWASADPSIAEVSSGGVVTGRKVGTVLIAASSRGKDAFSRITVNPTPVSIVRLSTTSRAMMVGQTFQLSAEAVDGSGNVLTGRPIAWSSSNTSVASVSPGGMVTALAPGAVIITASSEGKSAVATITISQVPVVSVTVTPATATLVVGQTTQLAALLKDETGSILNGRVVTWSTNRATVATVTSEGLVTAIAAGTATITASSEGRSATASISVSPRPVSAVIVSPEQVTLFAGQTVQLAALVTDDRGQVLTGKQVTFMSSSNQVATVSSQGLVTGVAAGTATITATSEGATGSATITIAPDPVAAVEISPSAASIVVGQTAQLTAIPRNISGQALSGRTVSWSTSSPSLASVSSTGVVTGISPGNAVIIASVEGRQASATVTVRAVPVASVQVTPSPASTIVGQTVTLTARTLDGAGNTLTGRIVGWTSSNTAIATVNASGVVTGVASGTATITASSEGVSGTTALTVSGVPVATVTVAPGTATIVAGQTTTLSATLKDANGNILTGRTITWSSGATSVATVSAAGVVTGVAAGTATITATSEGKSAAASVTVTAPSAATVTVAPSTATVTVGNTTTLVATVRDGSSNVMVNASVTWSTSNATVATVSSSGVVTGVAAGSATITARSGTASGTATITVSPPPIASIVVTPANPRIKVGDTIQMTATAYDAGNRAIAGVSFTWTSNNTNRATVSSTGLVRALNDGNVTITASAGGKSGSTTVRIDK